MRLQRLLRQPALSGTSSASTTVVVSRLRLHRRRRRDLRLQHHRQWRLRPQHRLWLQSLLCGRFVPRRVPCHRPCSGMASPRRPPAWLLRCQATHVPHSPMQIGARPWLKNTRCSWTMAPGVSFLDRLASTSSPASGSSSTSITLTALWLDIKPDGSFVGSRSGTASSTTKRSARLSSRPPSGSSSASPLHMELARPFYLAARCDDEAWRWHECFGHPL